VSGNLSQIVKQAFEVNCDGFTQIVEEAKKLLSVENGKTGNFEIVGRLIKLNPEGEGLIVGDLHGDLESLVDVLKESDFLKKMKTAGKAFLIFLGDYGDRGPFSAEVYYTVLKLKLLFPRQVILMRGNHEGPKDLMADPHDLPTQFQTRFGSQWEQAYVKTQGLFEFLYNAVLVKERVIMIHGGPPPQFNSIEDLAFAHKTHPKQRFLEDMLWSDPDETIKGTVPSPRGAGRLFGPDVTNDLLRKLGVQMLIRGHESCDEGFRINHDGKVLTLFSRKGPPYFNAHGAYLRLSFSNRLENANQLVPYIHPF
jgi:protein phosphatase